MALNLNELRQKVAEGEHDSQDFKVGTDPNKEFDVALDISVFANSAGGVLVYGVDNNGGLVGCTNFPGNSWKTDGQEALQNCLASKLRGYWSEAVRFKLDLIDDDAKRFIILTIPPSTALVGYRLTKNSDDSPWQHWKRSGQRKTPFSHSELLQKTELERNRSNRRAVQLVFLEEINRNLGMLGMYVSMAYGKSGQNLSSIDDELAGQLTQSGHKSIRESSSELFDELKGLTFLGLNLDDEVKSACLELCRALRKIAQVYSIWSTSQLLDQGLASWRQGVRNEHHIVALYRNQANKILELRERFITFSCS
jgi:predicted HTH transcriptional regulator